MILGLSFIKLWLICYIIVISMPFTNILLSDDYNTELAKKFRPIFNFHKDEMYFPISIEEYLENCVMTDNNGKIILENPTVKDLSYYENGSFMLLVTSNVYNNIKLNPSITIYAKVVEDDTHYYITYYMIFLNNIGYDIGCWKNVGEHLYDLEHITMKIKKYNESIETVFFSAHSDGEMKKEKDLEWKNSRIVVYVAKGSHAMYNRGGTIYRIWFAANDKCGQHISFSHNELKLLENNDNWVYFNGKMSQDGGSLMGSRYWFNEPWLEQQTTSRCGKIFRLC
jgi:hypothetical protein